MYFESKNFAIQKMHVILFNYRMDSTDYNLMSRGALMARGPTF